MLIFLNDRSDGERLSINQPIGQVTDLQPVDGRLRNGMNVLVEGGGETGRVVPR